MVDEMVKIMMMLSVSHLIISHLTHLNLFLIFGNQILVIAREEF